MLDSAEEILDKKMNVPITSLSSDEIYAMLNTIDSEDEDNIENAMNDSDTEFFDHSAIESRHLESDILSIETRTETKNNIIPTTKPIEAKLLTLTIPLSSFATVKRSRLKMEKAIQKAKHQGMWIYGRYWKW